MLEHELSKISTLGFVLKPFIDRYKLIFRFEVAVQLHKGRKIDRLVFFVCLASIKVYFGSSLDDVAF